MRLCGELQAMQSLDGFRVERLYAKGTCYPHEILSRHTELESEHTGVWNHVEYWYAGPSAET